MDVAMRRILIITLLLVGVCGSVEGAEYYVDADAAAGGDGSLATPWDKIADVNAGSFSAGDRILFQCGDIWTGEYFYIRAANGSGVTDSPITIGSYGSGAKPVIDRNSAGSYAADLRDVSHWKIDGLYFKGGTAHQILVTNSAANMNGISINNCLVDASTSAANNQCIRFAEAGGFGLNHIEVVDCELKNSTGNGDGLNVYSVTSGATITGNYIHNVGDDCIDVAGGLSHVVMRNICEFPGQGGIKVHGQQHLLESIIVSNNLIKHNTGTGPGLTISDSTDGLFLNNTIIMGSGLGHYGAITFMETNTPDSFTGNTIKNNLCVGNPSYSGCWWVDDDVQNTFTASNTFGNNLIYTTNSVIVDMDSGTDITAANWAAAWLPNHPNDLKLEPRLTRDYRLKCSSPARRAGDATVVGATDTDLRGHLMLESGKVNMGAYSGCVPLPQPRDRGSRTRSAR